MHVYGASRNIEKLYIRVYHAYDYIVVYIYMYIAMMRLYGHTGRKSNVM